MLLDTPLCNYNWQAPDFTLLDPDNNSFTMSEHLGDKGLLIAFICNHCPYVQAIVERLVADTNELMNEGINVVAIMSNDYHSVSSDSPANMKKFAKMHEFKFPYLIDEDQNVAKTYGAVCTPDFFGLNKEGKLQYRGSIDDARMGNPDNRNRFLVNAMRQIAETGQGPKQQIPSMGCSIKWH